MAVSATGSRIDVRDAPAFVRVTVTAPGAPFAAGAFEAVDADPVDGRVRVSASRLDAGAARTADGVAVTVARGVISVRADARRFKYLGLVRSSRSDTLELVLWKRRPAPGVGVRSGAGGCLAFTSWGAKPGLVVATGREANAFEHMFVLRVRDRLGNLVGSRRLTAKSGHWRGTVPAHVSRAQAGLVEAYDPGAIDGATGMCLAQVRVRLIP